MTAPIRNWAGNISFSARAFHRPTSVEQLQQLVAGSDRVRVLGTGHSFNRIADTTGDLICLDRLPRRVEVDPERREVTVGGGVRFADLTDVVQAAGFALHNLGSLPHIAVSGACATGTHGSGVGNGALATAVVGMELIRPDGSLVRVGRGDPSFEGCVIGLGSLGIVTSLTMELVPTFEIQQVVYDDLPYEQLLSNLDEVLAAGYSVSAFLDWRQAAPVMVWVKRLSTASDSWAPAPTWLGARLADGPRHPLPGADATHATAQLGIPGPWHERLPHFRKEFTPSRGEELQSEYFVAREHGTAAITALYELRDLLAPVLQVTELRTVAADRLWLSPSYQTDNLAIHFTWVDDTDAVTPVLTAIENALAPLNAKPHWGKLFNTSPDAVRLLFERHADFVGLLNAFDPAGKFRNEFIDTYF
ncbi:MAG TPA: FAD-binding protein [Jatrophihabitans sp.]|jgi:xylitol oxidase